jgi:hypothetical protein
MKSIAVILASIIAGYAPGAFSQGGQSLQTSALAPEPAGTALSAAGIGGAGFSNGLTFQPEKSLSLAPSVLPVGSVNRGRSGAGSRAAVLRAHAQARVISTAGTDISEGTRLSREGAGVRAQESHRGGLNAGAVLSGVEEARSQEKETGRAGFLDQALGKIFDFSLKRKRIAEGPGSSDEGMGPRALPDPKVLGPDAALRKVNALADGASPTDAPRLYTAALEIAGDFPADRAPVEIASVMGKASSRARDSVALLAARAFQSAAAGRRKEALRNARAVSDWSVLISGEGRGPWIANIEDFKAAVERVLSLANQARGEKLPAPEAFVEELSGEGGSRLVIKVRLSPAMASDVSRVPEGLSGLFGLPEFESLLAPSEGFFAGDGFRSLFRLSPRAGPGGFFRAERSAGRSLAGAFWASSRKWLFARAEGVLGRLLAVVRRILRGMGLLADSVPAPAIDDSFSVLEALRALPAQEASWGDSPASFDDPFGLGYRLNVPLLP